MVTATFRFYRELNEFLARPQRERAFASACPSAATVKHMIEALGVPHTEVASILQNGEPAVFDAPLAEGDQIDVYPASASPPGVPPLRPPLGCGELRFVADAHLGALAQLLRLAGFDTRYDNNFADEEVERLGRDEHRVVLTRDRELLKRRSVVHGCYVRALQPDLQFREVALRLALATSVRPFRLCLTCNAPLRAAREADLEGRVPEGVRERHTRFVTCDVCRRVFWEGSHWRRMRARIDALSGPDGQ
jgi:uncharacterized protein